MEKVLRNVGENSIIILFVMVILASTFYMGLSERRLSSLSQETNISQNV